MDERSMRECVEKRGECVDDDDDYCISFKAILMKKSPHYWNSVHYHHLVHNYDFRKQNSILLGV